MSYKVGDKVLLEAEVLDVNSDNNVIFPYYLGLKNNASYHCAERDIECISKTYEDGLNDAWELARKSYGFTCDKVEKIFGIGGGFYSLIKNFTPQEALAKIEAYEENKAIKVGDVVEEDCGINGVVIDIEDEDLLFVLDENGCVGEIEIKSLKKTGRHIDISSILEQIRGDE